MKASGQGLNGWSWFVEGHLKGQSGIVIHLRPVENFKTTTSQSHDETNTDNNAIE